MPLPGTYHAEFTGQAALASQSDVQDLEFCRHLDNNTPVSGGRDAHCGSKSLWLGLFRMFRGVGRVLDTSSCCRQPEERCMCVVGGWWHVWLGYVQMDGGGGRGF